MERGLAQDAQVGERERVHAGDGVRHEGEGERHRKEPIRHGHHHHWNQGGRKEGQLAMIKDYFNHRWGKSKPKPIGIFIDKLGWLPVSAQMRMQS